MAVSPTLLTAPKTLVPSTVANRTHITGLERSADSGPDFDHPSALLLVKGLGTSLSCILPSAPGKRLPGSTWK